MIEMNIFKVTLHNKTNHSNIQAVLYQEESERVSKRRVEVFAKNLHKIFRHTSNISSNQTLLNILQMLKWS